MEDLVTYIPLDKCKDKYLYKIDSRNLSYGVFRKSTSGFLGIRTKFGSRFIFEENHWDSDPNFGTVKPEKELIPCDIDIEDEKILFKWLEDLENSRVYK